LFQITNSNLFVDIVDIIDEGPCSHNSDNFLSLRNNGSITLSCNQTEYKGVFVFISPPDKRSSQTFNSGFLIVLTLSSTNGSQTSWVLNPVVAPNPPLRITVVTNSTVTSFGANIKAGTQNITNYMDPVTG
jgi:hypothetical protein